MQGHSTTCFSKGRKSCTTLCSGWHTDTSLRTAAAPNMGSRLAAESYSVTQTAHVQSGLVDGRLGNKTPPRTGVVSNLGSQPAAGASNLLLTVEARREDGWTPVRRDQVSCKTIGRVGYVQIACSNLSQAKGSQARMETRYASVASSLDTSPMIAPNLRSIIDYQLSNNRCAAVVLV